MGYFDNASTTFPKPECVYRKMDEFYRAGGGSFGRGQHAFALSANNLVDKTRESIRALLHCPSKQIIFEPTATISLNIIIQGIIKNGAKTIYISPFEHNAVTRTLHSYEKDGLIKVHQLTITRDLSYDLERIKFQFDETSPDLVIVSHASNVIGLVAPFEEIFRLAKDYGATTLLDMAQSAGLVDSNIGQETVDFAVFAGHKTMLGPTGISGFAMKPDYSLPPILYGGTGFDSANQDMPLDLPQRFEIGTMNGVGVAGLHAAVTWIQEQGINTIYKAETANRDRLLQILESYEGLTVVGNVPGRKYIGIVSCTIDGLSSDIAGQLFSERNISVRTGLHCAPLAHKFLNTYPAGTIRFSVNSYTSERDFVELTDALDDLFNNL